MQPATSFLDITYIKLYFLLSFLHMTLSEKFCWNLFHTKRLSRKNHKNWNTRARCPKVFQFHLRSSFFSIFFPKTLGINNFKENTQAPKCIKNGQLHIFLTFSVEYYIHFLGTKFVEIEQLCWYKTQLFS